MTETITSTAVYTQTLDSGNIFTIQASATFGEIAAGCLMLSLIAVLVLDITLRVAYGR